MSTVPEKIDEKSKEVSNSAEPTTPARVVETVNKSGVSVADCLTDHIVEQAETNQFNNDCGILRDYGIQSWKDQFLESQLLTYEQLMAMSRRTSVSLADSQEE
jgi:hypothetical protein